MRLPFRFSLRSLLLLVLAVGAALTAAQKWVPWQRTMQLEPTGHLVRGASFSPAGDLVVGSANLFKNNYRQTRTCVWNRSGEELYRMESYPNAEKLDPSAEMGTKGTFVYDSRWLVLHTSGNYLFDRYRLVDLHSKKMLFPEDASAYDVAFLAEGRRCIVRFRDENRRNKLVMYDLEHASVLCENIDFLVGKNAWPNISVSADNRRVMVLGQEAVGTEIQTYAYFLDLETGVQTRSRHPLPVHPYRAAFTPDGNRIVIFDRHSLTLIDVASDEMLLQMNSIESVEGNIYPLPTLKFIYYQAKGTTYWIDCEAKVIQPRIILGASLQQRAECADNWLAWWEKDTVWMKNVLDDADPGEILIDWTDGSSPRYSAQFLLTLGRDRSLYLNKRTRRSFETHCEANKFRTAPVGTKVAQEEKGASAIFDVNDSDQAQPRTVIPGKVIQWARDESAVVSSTDNRSLEVWSRVRDDSPGAFLFLPELWLAIAFFCAFLFSVRDDLRRLRSPV